MSGLAIRANRGTALTEVIAGRVREIKADARILSVWIRDRQPGIHGTIHFRKDPPRLYEPRCRNRSLRDEHIVLPDAEDCHSGRGRIAGGRLNSRITDDSCARSSLARETRSAPNRNWRGLTTAAPR